MRNRLAVLTLACVLTVVVDLVLDQGGTLPASADGSKTIWAGTWAGLYRSDDSGTTWQNVPTPVDNPSLARRNETSVEAVAVDPQNPDKVYIAGGITQGGSAIYRSADGGKTWSVTRSLLDSYPPALNGQDPDAPSPTKTEYWVPQQCLLCIDVAAPNHWYMGYWRSEDAGNTWMRMLPNGQDSTPSGLAIDPGVSGLVYANADRKLRVSHDYGVTWTTTPSPAACCGVFVNPLNGDVYAPAGCSCPLARSGDNGQTWTAVPFKGGSPPVAFDWTNGDIYTSGFKSTDNGNTWQLIESVFVEQNGTRRNTRVGGGGISGDTYSMTLQSDPFASGHLFMWDRKDVGGGLGMSNGYAFSTDGGKTVSQVFLPQPFGTQPAIRDLAFATPPRPQRAGTPVTQSAPEVAVVASNPPTTALRIVQSTARSLYFVHGTVGWLVNPGAIADDALGDLSLGPEWRVIAVDLIQPGEAQVVLGGDGKLYLVQGQRAWLLLADPISDQDLSGVTIVGQIDTVVPDGFLLSPTAFVTSPPAPQPATEASGAPDTLTDAVDADILAAVDTANSAWTTAKATLDTSGLPGAVAGLELGNDLAEVNALRSQGHRQQSLNQAFTVNDVVFDAPGHAIVHTTETWSAEVYSAATGQVLQRIPSRTYSETYTVEFLDGRWIVTLNELH